jgi:hypothetical protein
MLHIFRMALTKPTLKNKSPVIMMMMKNSRNLILSRMAVKFIHKKKTSTRKAMENHMIMMHLIHRHPASHMHPQKVLTRTITAPL